MGKYTNMDYVYLSTNPNFGVSTNEDYWWFDENGKLKSVVCIEDNEEKILPVKWDDKGAYIQYNTERFYVLNYNE